ncbi:MAG: YqgE/AlgH family protein [Tannerella sp.]|jgi:putative transcriptional regulator|nr:YqgE/AlgH family protein [Tannerella sp.]
MEQSNDIFKIKHNDLAPEKGSILIAEPFLQDAYFQRAVVLIIEREPEAGTIGFVLNKKTGLDMNDFFPELSTGLPIYMGGPVGSDHLFFIHTFGERVPDALEISDGLYFDGDFEALKRCLKQEGGDVTGKVKFFLGYSGWSGGQLEKEIEKDSWVVSRSVSRQILYAKDETYWRHSVEILGKQYKNWVNYPKDPYMN